MRAIFFPLLAVCLVSCAYQTPPISMKAGPDHDRAILFGRFAAESDYVMGNKLLLWLENVEDHESVYINFDKEHPVSAVTVKPGRYRLIGFAGITRLHSLVGRRRITPAGQWLKILMEPFNVPAGTEVYIGDFTGSMDLSFSGNPYGGGYQEWKLEKLENRFAQTTVDFRGQYPNLVAEPARTVFDPLGDGYTRTRLFPVQ